jgi:hypothetical protein
MLRKVRISDCRQRLIAHPYRDIPRPAGSDGFFPACSPTPRDGGGEGGGGEEADKSFGRAAKTAIAATVNALSRDRINQCYYRYRGLAAALAQQPEAWLRFPSARNPHGLRHKESF